MLHLNFFCSYSYSYLSNAQPPKLIFESHPFGNCCAPGMSSLLSIYLLWAHTASPPIRTKLKFAKNDLRVFWDTTKVPLNANTCRGDRALVPTLEFVYQKPTALN